MPRTQPTKAARKVAFELESAQLEVDIAYANWQAMYTATSPGSLSESARIAETGRWRVEVARLTHEQARLSLAYLTEEARITELKRTSDKRTNHHKG